MVGPGIYDIECTAIRETTEARGCIIIVLEGNRGTGFSCQLDLEGILRLPSVLRNIADQIEADQANGKL